MVCEICGKENATKKRIVALWNYGHREVKDRIVCNSCAKQIDSGKGV